MKLSKELVRRMVGVTTGNKTGISGIGGVTPGISMDDVWSALSTASEAEQIIHESHIPSLGISKISGLQDSLSNMLPKSGGTMTGALHMGISTGKSPYIYWGDDDYVWIGEDSDDHLTINGSRGIALNTSSGFTVTLNGQEVIHAGNIGSQSVTYATSAGSAGQADRLTNARSLWGQSFDGNSDVSGGLAYVSYIDFHYDGSSSYTSRIAEDASGSLNLNNALHANADGSVVIGGCTLSWDSVNGMLRFSTGIYSDGALSAGGVGSSGGGGEIENMTVTGRLYVKGSDLVTNYITAEGDGDLSIVGERDVSINALGGACNLSGSSISFESNVYLNQHSIYTGGGNLFMQFGKIYLGQNTRRAYLYCSSSDYGLYWFDGSTSIKIA